MGAAASAHSLGSNRLEARMSTIELAAPVSRDTDDADPFARLQRRTLATLIATQVTGGLGLASAVTVGSLIAAELGGAGAAGLPLAASVAGTATVAYPLSLVMRRVGRRRGLRLGWFAGAAGAVVAVGAVLIGSLPALLAGMLLFGGAAAASTGAGFATAAPPPGPAVHRRGHFRRGRPQRVAASATAHPPPPAQR